MNRARQLFDQPTSGFYPGAYLATVVSLADEAHRNRVQIRLLNADGIPDHDGPMWARVAAPFAGQDRGAFWLPDEGDEVVILFVQGDPRFPLVVGGLWNGDAQAPDAILDGVNRRKVLCSKNGVRVTLDDQDGQEAFIAETPGGQRLTLIDGPASLKLEDSNANSMTFEAAGITITTAATLTLNASQVRLSAGMISADAAMTQFSGVVMSDVHQSTTMVATTYTPGAGNIW